MGIPRGLQHDAHLACSDPTSDRFTVCFGEANGASCEEFDDHFAAANVCVKVRESSAAVVARDGSETNLTDALAPYRL